MDARVSDWHEARVSLGAEAADTYLQYRACGLLADLYERELTLSIPLFDGGKRRAVVDSTRASYTAALADYRQGTRNVVKEVEQALVNLDSAGRRAEDAANAAPEYRRYFQVTEANWRAGRGSLLTLEEARRSALSAQIEQITLQRDRVAY